jgi:ABC-type sugar transport system ATPase subunit
MLGSGVETIGGVMAGRTAAVGGSVRLNGRAVTPFGAESRKIGFVPSDRPHLGILPTLSVRENITLCSLRSMVRFGRVAGRLEDELAAGSVHTLAIQPRDTHLPISGLSGGNQQKAVLARWFAVHPPALVADEPTQGVDVWAKIEILNQLRRAARDGAAVVLTALEPEEVFDFCDRVIVLKGGDTVLDALGTAITMTDVLSAMH